MSEILCEYGCGQKATHQFKNGKWCCSKNFVSCPEYKKNNSRKGIKLKKERKKLKCEKCGREIGTNNYKKHFELCNGEINTYHVSEFLNENNEYECPVCHEIFSKYGIKNHIEIAHNGRPGPLTGHSPWNKGLTKELDERIKTNGETISKILKGRINGPLSEKHKENVSNGMKKAHEEGRAWNIGMNSWNGENSYPEKFFLKVIDNEFDDKNVIEQLQFSKYKLDFAWEHKKKCIEIDGDQHTRFENLIESDIRKDKLLLENGWLVLRIAWKDMYHDSKKWIKIAKDFIDE